MRDPKRIRPFLEKVAECWERYPDLRFGQFITNLFGQYGGDPWFPEEEDWEVFLDGYMRER